MPYDKKSYRGLTPLDEPTGWLEIGIIYGLCGGVIFLLIMAMIFVPVNSDDETNCPKPSPTAGR